MRLIEGESILVAWPETCAGPGWSNRVVWFIVEGSDGKLRRECLQMREDETDAFRLLWPYAEQASNDITAEVRRIVGGAA